MPSMSDLKVAVVTHYFATGPGQELAEFLQKRASFLSFIEHPFSYSSRTRSSCILFRNGKPAGHGVSVRVRGPDLLYFLKDLLYTLVFCVRAGERVDVFVGCGNLNAFGGVLLRAMGRTRFTVFYTVDYVPLRFKNRLINKVYHFLDGFCCRHADVVWNLAQRIAEAREGAGLPRVQCAPQLTVPLGNNFDSVPRLGVENIDRNRVAYMGHVRENQGLELLIQTFPQILEKIPAANLLVIGDGPLLSSCQEQAMRLGLLDKIRFTGFVEDHGEVERLLCSCAVGVAAYKPCPENFTFFTDPGKPKAYMAAGLPVVITRVPQVAEEIHKRGAGFAIDYDVEQLRDSVCRLLKEDQLYMSFRASAISFAKEFRWKNIFERAFEESRFGRKEKT